MKLDTLEGMSTAVDRRVVLARMSAEPLDLAAHVAAVEHPGAGAVDVFVGRVRDHDPSAGGEVVRLEYEAHPDADRVLERLAVAAAGGCDVVRIAVSHRSGTLAVGDLAVVVATSAPHRAEALATTRALIEAIKTDLPVWKRQTDEAGVSAWIGLQ